LHEKKKKKKKKKKRRRRKKKEEGRRRRVALQSKSILELIQKRPRNLFWQNMQTRTLVTIP
jgi:hypothetical protein